MKFYEEPKRQIPVTHEVDVLVVGAGPAGRLRGDFGRAYGSGHDAH